MTTKVWIVLQNVRPIGCKGPFLPIRITVVGGGPCDAYQQAATELGETYDLGWPISATPIAGNHV